VSTSKREKLERQAEHQRQKRERERQKLFGSPSKKRKKEFKEYVCSTPPYYRETPDYPSVTTKGSVNATAKRESPKYTGDLLVGIGTLHKSNMVPVMRGTTQAEDIAKMRRN
jgi:hypothetical protein